MFDVRPNTAFAEAPTARIAASRACSGFASSSSMFASSRTASLAMARMAAITSGEVVEARLVAPRQRAHVLDGDANLGLGDHVALEAPQHARRPTEIRAASPAAPRVVATWS